MLSAYLLPDFSLLPNRRSWPGVLLLVLQPTGLGRVAADIPVAVRSLKQQRRRHQNANCQLSF